jgi:hypothetical protein
MYLSVGPVQWVPARRSPACVGHLVKVILLYKVKTSFSRVDLLLHFLLKDEGASEISGWPCAFPVGPRFSGNIT